MIAGSQLPEHVTIDARDLGDARVHFAVVCASASCPDLLDEPFRGEVIDEDGNTLPDGAEDAHLQVRANAFHEVPPMVE